MSLSNFKVCIVSYAKYMENKKMGKIIDSYDKVVRINNGLNIVNPKYFGTKTDIYSSNFFHGKSCMIVETYKFMNNIEKELTIFDLLKIYKVKDILINNKNEACENIIEAANKYKLNFLVKPYKNLKLPISTGLQAIIQILFLKPKELFICGFDFSMFFFKDYEEHYKRLRKARFRLNKTYDEDPTIKHSTLFEKYVMKKLWIDYLFKVDGNLEKILMEYDITNLDEKCLEIDKFKEKYIKIYEDIKNLIENERKNIL